MIYNERSSELSDIDLSFCESETDLAALTHHLDTNLPADDVDAYFQGELLSHLLQQLEQRE